MQERLQKILSRAGVASRRHAEELIASGRVSVNGRTVSEQGTKADPDNDDIRVDGKPVVIPSTHRYLLLNKPPGYITTLNDPQGRPLVTDLLKGITQRLFPVGRLDYNTEGLLILTSDGEWANRLAHPRHGVEKEYHVRVRGAVTSRQLQTLAEGVQLDDGITSPATVGLLRESGNSSWISVAIHEGRYRQVRRMCEAVGLTVVRLRRVRYGSVSLGTLKPGEWRDLSPDEIRSLAGGTARDGRPSVRGKVKKS